MPPWSPSFLVRYQWPLSSDHLYVSRNYESYLHYSWAIGDISNPAYIPNPVLGYSYDMTFKERFDQILFWKLIWILLGPRCLNTLATIGLCAAISLYVRPQTEAIIANYFPGADIPSLEQLSSNIALHINHGSPFLGDGLRFWKIECRCFGFLWKSTYPFVELQTSDAEDNHVRLDDLQTRRSTPKGSGWLCRGAHSCLLAIVYLLDNDL